MKLQEVMTRNIEFIDGDAPLQQAAERMRDMDVGVMPVREDNNVVGLITDRDLVVRGVAEGKNTDSTPVKDIMTTEMWCMKETDTVEEAAKTMEGKKVRRLLVLNEQGSVSGIVSLGDVAVHSKPSLGGETLEEISKSASTES
jgi:CBS domain-containing protein